ncbi:hypothetical protein HGRIS_007980 [Hohenbuehelia grisea]|uniref:NUC153 domain-containing protein n=1 Tax=Hohenbuehelia grisea TaxID=104357 RepID=A0ABR3J7A8_9AGAR
MSDPRFARLKTDPRFRKPRKQKNKVVVDERFKEILEEPKRKGGKDKRVDKYGRKLAANHEQDSLKRYYRLENEDEDDESKPVVDLARGGVLLESSEEEEDTKEDEDDEDSDAGDIITIGGDHTLEEDGEIDLDENDLAVLDAQAEAYAQLNPEVDHEEGTNTRRIAVVNLDWDHVRATHLYKIFSSLVSPTASALPPGPEAGPSNLRKQISKTSSCHVVRGKVLSVRVYPSQFGKERLAREEKEGPPAEIFKKRTTENEEDINERTVYEVGNEDDYNEDALRKYQLERLRYYYAIVTCDTVEAATHIYKQLDGTELERSANVFDLSYVPEDMTFDDDVRDEATEEDITSNYKGVDFVTDALRHSKVKLTWDDDDPERIQITKRALTQKEIDEADFKAFLASASSGSEDDEPKPEKKSKKSDSRDKYRALLLGGGDNDMPEGWAFDDTKDDVDMEITFTPGLSNAKTGDETTLDKYQRKLKEKRKQRKEEVKEKAAKKANESEPEDDFFEAGSDAETRSPKPSSKKTSKKGRKGADDVDDAAPHKSASTNEELSLLVAEDGSQPNHFNMKTILKAEKGKKGKRKGKSGRRAAEDENELQEDFEMNVNDDRFTALLDDHTFAIDPSNPNYKKTKSMSTLLEERSKRQRAKLTDDGPRERPVADAVANREKDLKALVESVKRKNKSVDLSSSHKRRRT